MSAMRDPAEPTATEQPAPGPLPERDLADLCPGCDSPELKRDLADLAAQAAVFQERYQDRLSGPSGAELGAAVAENTRLASSVMMENRR